MTEEASQSEDRAAEEAAVPEAEAEVTPEQKARDEENAERSRLGRKVKELEAQLSGIGTLQEQVARMASLLESKQETNDEDEIVTTKTLSSYLQRQEQESKQKKQAYEKDYTSAFTRYGAEDDNFDTVWQEMVDNHNVIHTGDPKVDAQINYLAAQNALLRKPNNPLKGKGQDVKGVNTPDTTKQNPKGMPTLDPVAEDFVKRMGISADWVNEKLKPQ